MSDYGPISDAAVFDRFADIHIHHDNIEHYRALAEGRLVINRCGDCGHWIYPHRPLCPECWSWNVTPREVSGLGRVSLFTLLPLLSGEGRGHHGDILKEATRLAEAGQLRPRLDPRRFTLANVGDAHAALEDRSADGKIVVDIAE